METFRHGIISMQKEFLGYLFTDFESSTIAIQSLVVESLVAKQLAKSSRVKYSVSRQTIQKPQRTPACMHC